jgi:hypothetical protein
MAGRPVNSLLDGAAARTGTCSSGTLLRKTLQPGRPLQNQLRRGFRG